MARRSISRCADERLAVIIQQPKRLRQAVAALKYRASCRYSPLRERHRPKNATHRVIEVGREKRSVLYSYTAPRLFERHDYVRQYTPLVRRIAHQMIAKLPANVELDDMIQAA